MKKRVAVFFGGRSPEHDVSIVSSLQAMKALDTSKFDPFPVYITTDGKWLVGDILKERSSYFLDKIALKKTTQVTIDISASPIGKLIPVSGGMFGNKKPIEFDIALLGFHGLYGEDGNVQGLMEFAGVAYTGLRIKGSTILMDKITTKQVLQSADIPMLPYAVLKRPDQGYIIPEADIKKAMGDIKFPCILKPAHLGSSIGIAKVTSIEEVQACLPPIFEMDDTAMLEPFVSNLVEYNVAVARMNGEIKISAIERPKLSTEDELLDFAQKYKSAGDGKNGDKMGGTKSEIPSEGMLSLTREINPVLDKKAQDNIQKWASTMFEVIDGTGAPRIDFIGDSETGELWLNEVNPIPGSFGYFLWEASKDNALLFSELMTHLLEEAMEQRKKRVISADPVPKDARLFRRPL
ncbi:D-alanine--D-alanine ligase [Alphaproteobacteria bacterium]|nr:D-alanine--D-alanine ligase [Alphaproteobacteria bacterium]